jgi:hypothetical protein
MKRFLGLVLLVASAAALFLSCGNPEPAIPNDTVAKLTSQAVFSSSRAPDSADASLAAPRAVTITGENGGTAYLDFNLNWFNLFGFLSGSGTIDFTGWVVIDDADTPEDDTDDASYAIDDELAISWENNYDYDYDDEALTSTLSMTSTYDIAGTLRVSDDADEVTADIDLTTVYTYSCSYSETADSVTITCTAATTGTVNDEDVSRNFSFASEIGLPTIDITIGA